MIGGTVPLGKETKRATSGEKQVDGRGVRVQELVVVVVVVAI